MLRKSSWGWVAAAAVIAACSGELGTVLEESGPGSGSSSDPSDSSNPGVAIPEDPFPQDDPTCPDAAAVVSASNGWSSTEASQAAFETVDFEVRARPEVDNIDALVAIGSEHIDNFSDAAILIRFADNGLIDVRDDLVYDAEVSFPYEAGFWYTIVVAANLAAGTYDVDVSRCGEPAQALIRGAQFRSDAAVSDRLTTWAAWSSQSAKLDVATPMWAAAGSCAAATCESMSIECGEPSDGCGGALSCGVCDAGEGCATGGMCVDVTPPPPSLPPSGGPADTCPASGAITSQCFCGGSLYDSGYCCEGGYSFSACEIKTRYVRPGGGGSLDGANWANAMGGLPSTLERGTVYWLGAGNYSGYTFDDGASGQTGITLRKATSQNHGTNAGWNAAYGNGQAVFGPLAFESSRYTLDGGEPNGLKTLGQTGTKATVDIEGTHIVLRHVEIDGGLIKSGGKQTAGGCNGSNVFADYVVFDRCEVHNLADDGLGIYADHIKVLYSKIHDLDGCGTDGGCGPCFNGHSDGLELSNVSDIELVGNMIYDVRSTAALFMEDFGNGGISNLVAYNNVFYTPATGAAVYLKDLSGANFHNNIIWGRPDGNRYGGLLIGNVTNLELYNNIILNINYSHLKSSHNPSQHKLDYNLFGMINTGEYTANTHDVIGDPNFAGIPLSSNMGDHKGSNITLDDFTSTSSQVIDAGRIPPRIPAYDVNGASRPQGGAWDRGPFESSP